MTQIRTYARPILIIGDILLWYTSLYASLAIRSQTFPKSDVLLPHLAVFTPILLVWMVVFLALGLYEKHSAVLKNRLPSTIFQAQIINIAIAAILLYVFPTLDITPKTILFIYLLVSSVLIIAWRIYAPRLFVSSTEPAVIIGTGSEIEEVCRELKKEQGYPMYIVRRIDSETQLEATLKETGARIVIANLDSAAPLSMSRTIYRSVMLEQAVFIEFTTVYEEIFKRLPVTTFDERWFVQHIALSSMPTFDFVKRVIDLVTAIPIFLVSLLIYPFVIAAIKLETPGGAFFTHTRVGKNGKLIKIIKFRSMTEHASADGLHKNPQMTKVGAFIRKTRIDELPQLLTVIRGDVSLIGPRPELPKLVEIYEQEIPYYSSRHSVKPGLSGWAQINQKDPPKLAAQVESTAIKLSYDLYYIKNRSLWLDILIALRTVKELALRRGI
jgi:lipopolysaccharide/colanic/teichoic acid biosynthesis glycosyltransferase